MYGHVTQEGRYSRPKHVQVRTREVVLLLGLVGDEWIPQGANSFWLEPDKGRLAKYRDTAGRALAEIFNRIWPWSTKVVVESSLDKGGGYISKGKAAFRVFHSRRWKAKVRAWHRKGERRSAKYRRRHLVDLVSLVMAPRAMERDGQGHQFAAADIALDENTAIREAVAYHARKIMTLAELQGFDKREDRMLLAHVLAAVVEGRLTLETAVGLFMDKYAQFESKFKLKNQNQVRDKLDSLVGDKQKWTVRYVDTRPPNNAKNELLPLAVRNWISHRVNPKGMDANSYTREHVVRAIHLLNACMSNSSEVSTQ